MAVRSLAPDPELAPTPISTITRAAEAVVRFGLVAVILTLPLEFTATYFWQPLARWALAITGIAFVYLAATGRREVRLPREGSVVVLAVFLAVTFASWLLIRAPGSSKGVLDITLYPIAGLLMFNLARTEDDHRRAWAALLVSGLAVAALGAILFVTHWSIWTPNPAVANRLNITFGDPNITARFLTLCACAAVLMFAARKAPSWLAVATAIACALVLPLTFSRSGLALFMVSVVVAAVASTTRRRAAALAAGTLLVFAVSTGVNPVTRDRAESAAMTLATLVTGSTNTSAPAPRATGQGGVTLDDNRKYLVAAGVNMFVDHPLTGVGFGGYQHQLVTNYKRYLPPNFLHPDTASHTAFVTVAAEEGVIGLGLFLGFLVWLGVEAFRARRSVWVQIPMVLMVPIVLYSQFEGRLLEEPYFWLCLALVYAAFRLGGTRPPTLSRQPANRDAAVSRLPK